MTHNSSQQLDLLLVLGQLFPKTFHAGAAAFGSVEQFDYAAEVKNASLSSRPSAWDARDLGWENPTMSGRLGWRPAAAWNLGISASGGAYLRPAAQATLPAGRRIGDYHQYTLAHDIGYAWHH